MSRAESFMSGAGIPVPEAPAPPTRTCSACGFESPNRKHFKKDGDGHTCSTGHYEKNGELKRAKNGYATWSG